MWVQPSILITEWHSVEFRVLPNEKTIEDEETRILSNFYEAVRLTREVEENALSSGGDMVGILSDERIDSVPRQWVGWQTKAYSKKNSRFLERLEVHYRSRIPCLGRCS